MYKFLEYGDAHYVVDYIYESDIYDEEKFLFAPDVDILKTSELDIRNSLFTYFMQIFVEMDKTRNIKNILLTNLIYHVINILKEFNSFI